MPQSALSSTSTRVRKKFHKDALFMKHLTMVHSQEFLHQAFHWHEHMTEWVHFKLIRKPNAAACSQHFSEVATSRKMSAVAYCMPESILLTFQMFLCSGGSVFLKATCFQSKKYANICIVLAAIDIHGSINDRCCDCPVGSGACNHLLAVLRTVSHRQRKQFSKASQ